MHYISLHKSLRVRLDVPKVCWTVCIGLAEEGIQRLSVLRTQRDAKQYVCIKPCMGDQLTTKEVSL